MVAQEGKLGSPRLVFGIGVPRPPPGLVFTTPKPFLGAAESEGAGGGTTAPPHLHMLLQMAQAAALHVGKGFKLKSSLCFLAIFGWVSFPSLSSSAAHLPSLSVDGVAARWSWVGGWAQGGLQPGPRPTEAAVHPTVSPSQAGLSPISPQPSLAVRKWNCSSLESAADPPSQPLSSASMSPCHHPLPCQKGRRAPSEAQHSGFPSQWDLTWLCSKPEPFPTHQLLMMMPSPSV